MELYRDPIVISLRFTALVTLFMESKMSLIYYLNHLELSHPGSRITYNWSIYFPIRCCLSTAILTPLWQTSKYKFEKLLNTWLLTQYLREIVKKN